MALAVKIWGQDQIIYDANLTDEVLNGMVGIRIIGKIYKQHPILDNPQANSAAMYSENPEVDFPPIEIPINHFIVPSEIREVVEYTI